MTLYCLKSSSIDNDERENSHCGANDVNNQLNYNGTNGNLNNNNRINSNHVRVALEFDFQVLSPDSYSLKLEDLFFCFRESKKHKKNKMTYIRFDLNFLDNLNELYYSVNKRRYTIKESTAFPVTKPVLREIISADVSDRIIQTYFVLRLTPAMEQYLTDNSYSCRVGKGGLKAVKDLQDKIYKATNGYTRKNAYLYKIDMQSFFTSIDTVLWSDRLIKWIDKWIKGDDVNLLKYLTKRIYMSKPQMNCRIACGREILATVPERKKLLGRDSYVGIPIGNRSSQMFVNFITKCLVTYLNIITKGDSHYTDDNSGIVFNKKKFLHKKQVLEKYLAGYFHLKLHPDKFYLQHYTKGIPFLGFRLKYNRILPSKRVVNNFTSKILKYIRCSEENEKYIFVHKEEVMSVMNSYLGLMRHTSSYRLRKEWIDRLATSRWNIVLTFDTENYNKIGIKEEYKYKYYLKRITKLKKKEIIYDTRRNYECDKCSK